MTQSPYPTLQATIQSTVKPALEGSLPETLSQQLTAHGEVNKLLQDLRLAVVNGDTQVIQQLNQKLLAVGTTLKQLESHRQQQVEGMGYPASMPLREIIPKLHANEQQELQLLRDKLSATIYQVQQERKETNDVIGLSTRWVKQTLGLIAQQVTPAGASYGNNGGAKPSASSPNPTMLHGGNPQQLPTNSIIERKA